MEVLFGEVKNLDSTLLKTNTMMAKQSEFYEVKDRLYALEQAVNKMDDISTNLEQHEHSLTHLKKVSSESSTLLKVLEDRFYSEVQQFHDRLSSSEAASMSLANAHQLLEDEQRNMQGKLQDVDQGLHRLAQETQDHIQEAQRYIFFHHIFMILINFDHYLSFTQSMGRYSIQCIRCGCSSFFLGIEGTTSTVRLGWMEIAIVASRTKEFARAN